MKRSRLERKTELKPGKPLARTSRLKPGKHVTYGTPEERAAFREAIYGKPCVVCGLYELQARIHTGYGLQAHHAVEAAYLKKHGLAAHLWDPRNAVPLCEEPCHRRHTSRKRPLTWEELPACAIDFADGLNLRDFLIRTYPSMKETK